jgi:cysteine desulfurase / selenocysteine lyase|tara:strand:- start:4 stop:1251 length:1248 start_codon:yes stop_codon:yes gene_type:complete
MKFELDKLASNVKAIRQDFPILDREVNGKRLAYLDNAASSQRPISVINKFNEIYSNNYANVHRGVHTLSMESTELYENVRKKIADFINVDNPNEIIYTKGTTESINIVAHGWAKQNLKKGDKVVLSEVEHHANLVPWFMLRDEIGIIIEFIPVLDDFNLDLDSLDKIIDQTTRLVAVSQISNSLGTIIPLNKIIDTAHSNGALVLVDAAQSVPHQKIDVQDLGADFLVFSAHKLLGPNGVGVLWSKMDILEQFKPFIGGGDMISKVTFENASWNEIPYRFEAGTPNITGVIAFGEAIDYLNANHYVELCQYSYYLSEFARKELSTLPYIEILGPSDPKLRSSLFSFDIKGVHPHDVAQILDSAGVAIRAGHHCAQPTLNRFGFSSTARASFYLYNDMDDVEQFIESISLVEKRFL